MARVAHYSHNGLWLCVQWQQPAPDRVLVGKETSRQRFVDDRDLRGLGPILCGERSSCAHLQAHRLKVVMADEIDFSHRLLPRLKWRTPFDLLNSLAQGHP